MVCAGREVVSVANACIGEHGAYFVAAEVLFAAHAEEECVNLVVESIGIFEDTVAYIVETVAEKEESAAERTDMREFIELAECYLESFVSAPRQAGHGAVVAVGAYAECLFDERY